MPRHRAANPWLFTLAWLGAGCGGASGAPPAETRDAAADLAAGLTPPPDVAAPLDVADDASPDVAAPRDAAADAAPDVTAAPDVGPDVSRPDSVVVADAAPSVGPYPAGPYGNREGDVLANLPWEGYVNDDGGVVSTMRPYGPTSLQAVRETGRRYGIVHVSEFY